MLVPDATQSGRSFLEIFENQLSPVELNSWGIISPLAQGGRIGSRQADNRLDLLKQQFHSS